ncbi:MAG: DUF523 domain-containing protein [Desulfuromonadales bacterium]
MQPILISACLLGILTRYDGLCKRNAQVIDFLRRENLIPVPVCPEQLAGLPTPRPATCFAEGDGAAVLDGRGRAIRKSDGQAMNETFLKGAIETMKVARMAGCRQALLKERSPSCGVHQIHLGEEMRSGRGVTAALLERNGIEIFSEEDLNRRN